MRLAVGTQLVLDPRNVLGRRVVLGTEQAQQRAAEFRCQIDGRHRAGRRQVVGPGHDAPAIAVDGGIEGQRAGDEVRLAPARAVPDDTDLARGRQRPQVLRRTGDVADALGVGHPARLAGRGGVGRLRPRGVAMEQVGADGVVAVDREGANDLLGGAVVAGHVVDHDHPAVPALVERDGLVRLDLVAVVARDCDRLGADRALMPRV